MQSSLNQAATFRFKNVVHHFVRLDDDTGFPIKESGQISFALKYPGLLRPQS